MKIKRKIMILLSCILLVSDITTPFFQKNFSTKRKSFHKMYTQESVMDADDEIDSQEDEILDETVKAAE